MVVRFSPSWPANSRVGEAGHRERRSPVSIRRCRYSADLAVDRHAGMRVSRLGRISISEIHYTHRNLDWTRSSNRLDVDKMKNKLCDTGESRFWSAAFCLSLSAEKKNPDDTTQTLDLPKDPPMVAVGESRRLVFHVSPLSAKGLLSQQTRDALKAILKANGGAPVIHIRAFVAGSGDLRRVPQIVSEVFTEKKLPLPSVSVVQAGGLHDGCAGRARDGFGGEKRSESGWAPFH